jgi:hypothetical protein
MSTPEALYRNAIDLNRYSNSVARRVINAYNDIIIDAVNQLRGIDDLAAPVKAARLRAILAQLKDSLGTWAGDATELTCTGAARHCAVAIGVCYGPACTCITCWRP